MRIWRDQTDLDTMKARIAVNAKGGAQSKRVTVRLNPIVALNVGKYALKLNAVTWLVIANESHQTFQSFTAAINPAA